jgi:hypothetical protein
MKFQIILKKINIGNKTPIFNFFTTFVIQKLNYDNKVENS